jgi:hypothetical protein
MIFNTIFELILFLIPYVYTLSPLSLTKPITDGFGVNIHFTHPKTGEMEMIAEAGFKWVRMDFHWHAVEQKKGEYNFKDYEFLMNELEKHNMSALFILGYSNTLYEKDDVVITEDGLRGFTKFAATAVEHFKGRGILWEMWNEPNLNSKWNATQYVTLALETGKAIQVKTPNEILIGPAAAQIDLNFLEKCFKAGILNYWDGISVHPYRQTGPENVASEYRQLRDKINKYAPKGKTIAIISGEWGYSTLWSNETIQGKFLARKFLTNVMNNIPVSIWYDWHDDGTNKTDQEHNFGIVFNEYKSGANPVYKPKESYLSAKTMNTVLKGFHFVKRIATNDEDDYVLLFSDSKNLRLVAWTSSPQFHEITIPSNDCDFELIHHKGSPIEKLSAKNGSLTLKLNDFTHFIVVKGPNYALETATDANFIKAVVEPISGNSLIISVYNLEKKAFNVTVDLSDIKGIKPNYTSMNSHFSNESVVGFKFDLKSKPENEFTIGLRVEGNGYVRKISAHKYQFASNRVITDCKIVADGDPKIQSEQSVSIHSAPELIFDSDFPVLKIDYHFYGRGAKWLEIFPDKIENRKIVGQPKGFGLWVYGDNQGIMIKMRIVDTSHQTLQLSQIIVDWKGWKYVQMFVNEVGFYWGGSNDGVVHYPIEYNTLLIIDNWKHSIVKSSIFITSPVIIY